jgi:hypothetical protein
MVVQSNTKPISLSGNSSIVSGSKDSQKDGGMTKQRLSARPPIKVAFNERSTSRAIKSLIVPSLVLDLQGDQNSSGGGQPASSDSTKVRFNL